MRIWLRFDVDSVQTVIAVVTTYMIWYDIYQYTGQLLSLCYLFFVPYFALGAKRDSSNGSGWLELLEWQLNE